MAKKGLPPAFLANMKKKGAVSTTTAKKGTVAQVAQSVMGGSAGKTVRKMGRGKGK